MKMPDYLPTLDKGNHHPGQGRACVMEYVSVLAGEAWSDRPACVDPLIAATARNLNDSLYDGDRARLITLVNRLLVAKFPDQREDMQMALCRYAEDYVRANRGRRTGDIEDLGMALVHRMMWTPDQSIANLTMLLDRMDLMMRRPVAPELPSSRLAEATVKAGLDHRPEGAYHREMAGWTMPSMVWYDEAMPKPEATFIEWTEPIKFNPEPMKFSLPDLAPAMPEVSSKSYSIWAEIKALVPVKIPAALGKSA